MLTALSTPCSQLLRASGLSPALCAVQAHLVAPQPQSQPASPICPGKRQPLPSNLFVKILSICLLCALQAAEWTMGTE